MVLNGHAVSIPHLIWGFFMLLLAGCAEEFVSYEEEWAEQSTDEWCEGNTIYTTKRPENQEAYSVAGVNCSDYSAECVQWLDDKGDWFKQYVGCAIPGETCQTAQPGKLKTGFCLDEHTMAICEENGRYVMWGCYPDYNSGRLCALNNMGIPDCAFDTEPCEGEDEKCDPEFEDSFLRCVNGVWSAKKECGNGNRCYQNNDGTIDCADRLEPVLY